MSALLRRREQDRECRARESPEEREALHGVRERQRGSEQVCFDAISSILVCIRTLEFQLS